MFGVDGALLILLVDLHYGFAQVDIVCPGNRGNPFPYIVTRVLCIHSL